MLEPPHKIGVVLDPTFGAGSAVLQSNLERYGYDMVVAITQKSINRALRKQLQSRAPGAFGVAYLSDPDGKLVPMSAMDFNWLSTIPDHADQSDKAVRTLEDQGFDSAFFGEFGLPPGVDEDKLDLVVFDRDTSRVSYHVFFKSLTICTLDSHKGGKLLVWQKITQPQDQPWVFGFIVNLDMNARDQNAFNNLPPSVQQQIKNLNPNSAFSLTQLMLDLNTTSLQDSPAIEGLDPNSRVYETLARVIFDNYWTPLKNSGGAMLSYGVLPVNPNSSPTQSIVPTDINIVVSAHRDGGGNETHNYDLYTLNHLIMSENRPMPQPGQFSWNWLAEGDNSDGRCVGVVAIKRDIFAGFLKRPLGQSFSSLEGAGFSPFEIIVSGGSNVPWPEGVIPLVRFRSQLDQGDLEYVIFGDILGRDGDVIRLELRLVAEAMGMLRDLGLGRVIDLMWTADYVLQVDSSGVLSGQMQPPQFVNQSVDGFDQYVRQFNLQDALPAIDDAIRTTLNGSHAWIFPGGPIVAYRNVAFSAYGDLLAYFYYDPVTN